jgi:predicted ester cyclase
LRRNIRLLRAAIIFVVTVVSCFVTTIQAETPTPAATTTQNQAKGSTPPEPTGASQNSSQPSASAATSGETPEALARKYIELWNTGNKAGIDSFPTFIMHNHGGRVLVDPPMLGRVIANWRRSMPDLTFTVDDTVTQGNKIVMRVTLKGTYKERLFPESGDPPAPPRLVRATGIFIFKAADGKIQEMWQELDESILRVEMGGVWKKRAEPEGDAGSKSKDEALPVKP